MTSWLQQYMLLVLRIGKAVQTRTGDVLYDFYGPRHLEEQAAGEGVWPAEALRRQASALVDDLALQSFDSHRAAYLSRQLTALDTVCRRLEGERLSVTEEARRYFGLDVQWIPESIFEEALALYEQALPGKGGIPERLAHHRAHDVIPKEKTHLLPGLLRRAVEETRRRTDDIIRLPDDGRMEFCFIDDKPVKAMAQYSGDYRSTIIVNAAIPFHVSELLSIVSHEGYPGHIAEFVLKEEYLVKRKGCPEHQAGFLLTPPFVISEGTALLALETIFAPGEAERWMADHIYPELGIPACTADLLALQKATDLLRGAWCNAALLLGEGRSDSEAARYIMRHTLCGEEAARRAIQSLRRPYCESYIFTYYHGRLLLEPALHGPEKRKNLIRLLTEPIAPSDLRPANGNA